MIRSSGTGCSPTKPVRPARRWPIAPRGSCAAQPVVEQVRKKKGKNQRPGPAVHDDLVKRDFSARAANELWLTDITEHKTAEGKLYLCAIKDVYSNRIVGYSIDSRMKSRIAVNALDSAVARRGDVAGCIVHSDRGSQSARGNSCGP